MSRPSKPCKIPFRPILRTVGAAISLALCASVLLPFATMGIFNVGSAAVLIVFAPTAGICLCPAAARALRDGLRRSRAGRILLRAVAVFLILLTLYCTVMTGAMVVACAQTAPADGDTPLIVLGCQVFANGPSPMLRARLNRALRYLNDHPNALCVVSGGQGANEHASEAAVMCDWLIARGISPERLLTEDQSANTQENIQNSLELLRAHGVGTSAAICTDWWHELRARIWTERAGATYFSAPCATYPPLLVVYYARELCGTVRMVAAGY